MANVDLKYVCGTSAEEFHFQTSRFAKTRSADFHTYSWNPDAFSFDYGESVKRFGKEALTYTAEIYVYGSPNQKRAWLDNFHMACDQDIVNGTPGRIYWGDMYIECYIVQSSYEPLDRGTAVVDTVGIYCPYPSWIYEVTYAPDSISDAEVYQLMEKLYFQSDNRIVRLPYDPPFNALPSDFLAILLGSSTSKAAEITISTTAVDRAPFSGTFTTDITFPTLNLTAGECLVVDSRHGKKTATKYGISSYNIDLDSAENVYGLRASESRPFEKIRVYNGPYSLDPIEVEDCYGPTGYADHTVLTVFFERSEPTWIS